MGTSSPGRATSIVQDLKQTLGIDDDRYTYRCDECSTRFESEMEPESYWLACPGCDADAVTVEETA